MQPQRPVLYLDICAILEAVRTKCWRQTVARFEPHTVRECRFELEGRGRRDRRYVAVDPKAFDTEVLVPDPGGGTAPADSAQGLVRMGDGGGEG